VLQQRLKQAGMRWNIESAQPVLTLKAKAESDLWEKDVVIPFVEASYLLICGFDDISGNIKKAMTIWSKKDNKCHLQMIKNAGHNSNQDNPEDVNKCILTFINDLNSQRVFNLC
jgi:pimeloyl-ACP methyl ester carboxylesterase